MFTNHGDMQNWIKEAESEFANVQAEYAQNRRYYENIQQPSDENGVSLVPDELSYLVVNKIKPHVNLQISKVVGGKVDVNLKGSQAQPHQELLAEINEKNKFHEEFLEKAENFRHVEGLAGLKFVYDPYHDGPFGLGMPEYHAVYCGDGAILLDPNATDGTHTDDQARAYRKKVTLKEALNNPLWRHKRDEIKAETKRKENHDRLHLDIYEIEFVESYLVPAFFDPAQGRRVPISQFISRYEPEYNKHFEEDPTDPEFTGDFGVLDDVLDRAKELLATDDEDFDEQEFIGQLPLVRVKVVLVAKCAGNNGRLLLEPPKPTGYSGFTIIPSIHTVRQWKHKYPASDVFYLRYEQDRINMLNSMIVDSVRKGLKNFTVITGVNDDQERSFVTRKIGNVAEILFLRESDARFQTFDTPSIPMQVLQSLEISNQNFETIGNTNEPDRGQPIDLSGKAIQSLQARADIPVYVNTVHLESALVELFRRTLECMQQKLTSPFNIRREIDGKMQTIYFNTPIEDLKDIGDDELFVVSKDKAGNEIVNMLSAMNIPEVGVDITTNTLVKEQERINKAIMMYNLQQLHPRDLHKAVFPENWNSTFEEALQWNQGLQLTQQMSQLTPAGSEHVQSAIQEAALMEQTADNLGFKDQPSNGAIG